MRQSSPEIHDIITSSADPHNVSPFPSPFPPALMAPATRTALVTGANKGIGLAIVRNIALQYPSSTFSANGTIPLFIYLTARDQGRGEAAIKTLQDDPQLNKAKALAKDGGISTIKYRGLDISKDESIMEMG
ncbi:MAG: hypothetical protein Q9217_005528 [Psora testacea]